MLHTFCQAGQARIVIAIIVFQMTAQLAPATPIPPVDLNQLFTQDGLAIQSAAGGSTRTFIATDGRDLDTPIPRIINPELDSTAKAIAPTAIPTPTAAQWGSVGLIITFLLTRRRVKVSEING